MSQTILVTGASTGIGYETVKSLVYGGYTVVATVRKATDAQKIKNEFGEKVHLIQMDVSDFEKIDQLPQILKHQFGITKLYGLVNNAGVANAAPFLHQDFKEIQDTITINVLGLMKVTQVLLPLLGASDSEAEKGRIINISSVAGKIAAPFLSSYAASKHAVEGFSDGLRRELMLYGIKVIVVGPGAINTPIWSKGFESVKIKFENTKYGPAFTKFMKIASHEAKFSIEPAVVGDLIFDIFAAKNPCYRYAPVPRKAVNWYIPLLLPKSIYNKLVAKTLGF